MKKTLVIAAMAIVALAGCKKVSMKDNPEQEGYLFFDLQANDEIVVETKAAVAAAVLDAFSIKIGDNAPVLYSAVKGKAVSIAPGTYTITAENITTTAAEEGAGQLRMAATAVGQTVTAGVTTPVNLACEVLSSKLTVVYTDAFKAAFQDYTFVADPSGRNQTIAEGGSVFFNNTKDGTVPVNYTISAKHKSSSKDVSSSNTITLKNAYHHTATVNVGTNGGLSITISADDALTAESNDIIVDPYAVS